MKSIIFIFLVCLISATTYGQEIAFKRLGVNTFLVPQGACPNGGSYGNAVIQSLDTFFDCDGNPVGTVSNGVLNMCLTGTTDASCSVSGHTNCGTISFPYTGNAILEGMTASFTYPGDHTIDNVVLPVGDAHTDLTPATVTGALIDLRTADMVAAGCNPTALVKHPTFTPTQKALAKTKAFGFETVSAAAGVAALACIAKFGFGNPVCVGFTSIGTTFAGYTKALNRIADDPPRDDFTEPCVVEIETIDPLGAGKLRQQTTNLLRNGARINGSLDAAICAAEKSAGAEIAGATDWRDWQADQAQAFLQDTSPMFGRGATILQNMITTLQARGVDTSFLDGVPESLIELQKGFAP